MTKEKIKAAFFDIDGTLAEMKSHVIPDSTRKALHRLREKGICCVLSTGRHPLEVSEENILPDLTFDGGIWLTGQFCELHGKCILQNCFTAGQLAVLKEFLERHGRSCIFLEKDAMYCNLVDERIKREQERIGTAVPPVRDTADLEKRRLIEELRHVGCTDMLTGLKNRNEYMWKLNELKKKKLHSLGVIFIDMNGLKQMNDTKGHEYGDAMIRKTAECIIKYTSDNAYRIGGDEFIALWEEITREEFDDKVEKLKREFAGIKEYTISMGHIWEEGEIDIQQQVKKADASMYEAKQAYYQNRHNDRRKRRE